MHNKHKLELHNFIKFFIYFLSKSLYIIARLDTGDDVYLIYSHGKSFNSCSFRPSFILDKFWKFPISCGECTHTLHNFGIWFLVRAVLKFLTIACHLSFTELNWIYFKGFRQLWLRPYGWWWDELVEWKKWEETGAPRENPRTRCLSTTKPTWHEQGSIRGPLAPEVSALPSHRGPSFIYISLWLLRERQFFFNDL